MKQLFLEDLKDKTEKEIKEHLISEYAPEDAGEQGIKQIRKQLSKRHILIAYESVGSWGCDSSAFFLFRDKTSGKLYELHASHCSCYGFEGQYEPEETTLAALKNRIESSYNKSAFSTGGYDENERENVEKVNAFILAMRK